MTSMVDIVFLLIIFFVLVSQFISAENVTVDLPRPQDSLAQSVEFPERLVLNCRYVEDPAGRPDVRYRLGPVPIDSLQELQARLRAEKQRRADVQVILRADRRISYAHIRDAMRAIAKAGIETMNIAAEVED